MSCVLLVDDHRLIYDGLRSTLQGRFGVDHAASLAEARALRQQNTYAAIILDLSVGRESGLDLLRPTPPSEPVFVLTMHKSLEFIGAAMELGVRGYFLKDEGLDTLLLALEAPHERSFWIPEALDRQFQRQIADDSVPLLRLTERERQVLVLSAEGVNYKDIALRLGISPKTVNVHRENVMKKMGFESTADLVRGAIRWGLIVP